MALRGIILTVLSLAAATAAASEDLPGSADLPGIPRFPASWILEYAPGDAIVPYEYVFGPVTKSGAFVRGKESLRLRGRVTKVTYQIPPGVTSVEVFAHFQSLVAVVQDDHAFLCSGRDCGRSQHWASGIFENPTLYGPDKNQFYLASPFSYRGEEYLLSIYVIQRGNRRVYAHLELLSVEEMSGLTGTAELMEELNRNGHAVIEGVGIEVSGAVALSSELRERLRRALESLANRRVYVVCHLYGAGDADTLIENSRRCARNFVQALGDFPGPDLVAFGAGPLFPRSRSGSESHVELVIP